MQQSHQRRDLRRDLITAMLQALRSHPANEVSIADLARRLGVSAGAPYRHFRDRPELLDAIATQGFDQLRLSMSRAMAKHASGSIDRIVACGMGYIEFSADNPHLFSVMWALKERQVSSGTARSAGERTYMSFLSNLANTMVQQGWDDADPMDVGAPIWAMVHGYASLVVAENRMLDPRSEVLKRQVHAVTQAYLSRQ